MKALLTSLKLEAIFLLNSRRIFPIEGPFNLQRSYTESSEMFLKPARPLCYQAL